MNKGYDMMLTWNNTSLKALNAPLPVSKYSVGMSPGPTGRRGGINVIRRPENSDGTTAHLSCSWCVGVFRVRIGVHVGCLEVF